MKIVLAVVAIIVVAVVVIYVIGSRLPVQHVASREVRLAAPPAQVYALLRDVGNAPQWRDGVKTVEIVNDRTFRENGEVTYEIVEEAAPRKLVTRIASTDLGYGGSWTYDLVPDGSGTLLRITENGEVTNVSFRFLSRYVFGHTATIEKVLASAKRHFG